MGPIRCHASLQTSRKERPSAGGLSPRIGRKASLWSTVRSGPQTMHLGNFEESAMPTAVLSAVGQFDGGPSSLADQSCRRIAEPISPPPSRKFMEPSIDRTLIVFPSPPPHRPTGARED